jgi:hypothetical protein
LIEGAIPAPEAARHRRLASQGGRHRAFSGR